VAHRHRQLVGSGESGLYYQWVSIGSYSFSATGDEYVELGDATGKAYSTRRQVGFDAVKPVK